MFTNIKIDEKSVTNKEFKEFLQMKIASNKMTSSQKNENKTTNNIKNDLNDSGEITLKNT